MRLVAGLIDTFKVVYSVTLPFNGSKTGDDFVLIQMSLLLFCEFSRKVCIKASYTRSDLQPHLHFI